jgi:hypothetical protein
MRESFAVFLFPDNVLFTLFMNNFISHLYHAWTHKFQVPQHLDYYILAPNIFGTIIALSPLTQKNVH